MIKEHPLKSDRVVRRLIKRIYTVYDMDHGNCDFTKFAKQVLIHNLVNEMKQF